MPRLTLVITPFFGAQPASSPMLRLKNDLFFNMISWPEILTVVEPLVQSDAMPVFGYGIGTPGGVTGVVGGVKQTSGKAQIDLPAAALQEISRVLAKTLLAMVDLPLRTLGPPVAEAEHHAARGCRVVGEVASTSGPAA